MKTTWLGLQNNKNQGKWSKFDQVIDKRKMDQDELVWVQGMQKLRWVTLGLNSSDQMDSKMQTTF